MVYTFIINTLLPGSSKIIYYKHFVPYDVDIVDESTTAAEVRSGRRKQRQQIADMVHSEYQFRRSLANRSVEEDVLRLGNDDTLPDLETGHILLTTDSEQFVTWMGAGYTGFALVCDTTENRLLAESVLRLLIRYLQEHVRVLTQPTDVGLRTDRVGLVLSRFLPQGSLLFMNNRVVRQFEKELDTLMKS
ncbi:AP-5 complex subunit sigma-1-like [Haliotis rubra]|uniref:AP-5 complex subunit sigma-1-like n=1 Tax=Haliotis rubra TaxID=36100 RepID=UPI001EE5D42E|nr:AP-5 complex subunit sigma-1-like [Haliotis rubra]